MIGLYDRFIHQGALRSASDTFQSAMYIPEEGVMAFYHRMMWYAARMVRPPDRYTFKRQLIMRLPKDIFDYLLSKEVSAEYSTMESILHHARRAEENVHHMVHWLDAQREIEAIRAASREPANLVSDSASDSGGEPPLEASQEGMNDVSRGIEKVG